jgi:Coenzyme PQQ synthesis protein D (PqqD)
LNCYKLAEPNGLQYGLSTITGETSYPDVYISLAHTLSNDRRFQGSLFVVRHNTENFKNSGLYAFGEFTPVDMERFRHLSLQTKRVDLKARYVDYIEAEHLTETLASRLKDRYGRQELLSFDYRAIPRGGLIVMGMLSYALGLPAESVFPSVLNTGKPLVFIDDCVLSGMRFQQQLKKFDERKVAIAALFAPADLCNSTEKGKFPFDCISAVALEDLGPKLYGKSYDTWQTQWAELQGNSVLWRGQPEYLCFPWNEPESSFLNTITGEIESGFHFAPKGRCLHHRQGSLLNSADDPPIIQPVQIHDDGPGPINAASDVVAARIDANRIAVADFSGSGSDKTTRCFLLEDSAADMWEQLIKHGTVDKASQILSLLYDTDQSALSCDISHFTDSLINTGLLIHG